MSKFHLVALREKEQLSQSRVWSQNDMSWWEGSKSRVKQVGAGQKHQNAENTVNFNANNNTVYLIYCILLSCVSWIVLTLIA